jgi:arylsulfatase A-like enzyme
MRIKFHFLFGGLIAATLLASTHGVRAANKPNIVFILADDMGWGDIEPNNPDSLVPTPHLNKLASQGMRFTDAHASGSTCAPSRYGILTGRNPMLWPRYQYRFDDQEWDCLTLPQMLKDAGYSTHCIGKWHFGVEFKGRDGSWGRPSRKGKWPGGQDNWDLTAETRYGPVDRGFDYFFGTPYQPGGGWLSNMEGNRLTDSNPEFSERGLPVSADFDIQKWLGLITGKTVDRITELSKTRNPFFLYFPINSPHSPIVPDEPFIGKTKAGAYGDYCHQVDWSVGQVMDAIHRAGIAENTILIFTSDNGSYMGVKETSLNTHKANAHFRGVKKDLWEGGQRVPYLVSWPGKINPGTVCEDTFSLMDHMRTLATILKIKLDKEDAPDSVDMAMAWAGKPVKKRTLFHYGTRVSGVRSGKWKLIEGWQEDSPSMKGRTLSDKELAERPEGQLYDLDQDEGEQNNLWDTYPEVVKNLRDELADYRKRTYTNKK